MPASEATPDRRYLIPFRSQLLPQIFTDVLVIGSGVAGLRAALEASASGEVIVLAKGPLDRSNTWLAQGGIAAVIAEDDAFDSHVEDTLVAGASLCERATVESLVADGPAEIDFLIERGMRFDRALDGSLALTREGGHHCRRIVHSDGDATGRELVRTLLASVSSTPSIRMFEQCFALDLLTSGDGKGGEERVLGAITHHPKYGLQIIWARAVILATGGVGQLWRETTNSRIATGDGVAMAWRAGAKIVDMEFAQFHPTALYIAGAPRSLISEAVRGEGAKLVDRAGRRFMEHVHPLAELAPRDIVSRGIVEQLARVQDSCVFLDAKHMGSAGFSARFPGLTQMLAGYGIDPGTDLIPVTPAAHYTIGGVATDLQGRTSVAGLFAAGEVAWNGLHGANRLASNSLLEGLVFGQRAGSAASREGTPRVLARIVSDIRPSDRAELDLADSRSSLTSAMWRNVGIMRSAAGLEGALDMIAFWSRYSLDKIFDDIHGWELQNLLIAGSLVTRAAVWREESRGTHTRTDFPRQEDRFLAHSVWQRHALEPTITALGEVGACV